MTGLPLRLAVLLLAVTLGAGCAEDYYRPAPERAEVPPNALRVGITSTYPPMIFRQGGQVTGAEADLARLLGPRLGRPVYFIEVPWDQQIDTLIGGKTDIIMSGMSVTDARAVRIAFTEPYLEGGLMAAVRTEECTPVRLARGAAPDHGNRRRRRGDDGRRVRPAELPERPAGGALDGERRRAGAPPPHDRRVHPRRAVHRVARVRERGRSGGHLGALEPREPGLGRPAGRRAASAQTNESLGVWKRDGTLTGVLVRWLPYLRRG